MGEAVGIKYQFMEALPPDCPASVGAVLEAYEGVWRFVSNNPPKHEDFQSWAAVKEAPPTASACNGPQPLYF